MLKRYANASRNYRKYQRNLKEESEKENMGKSFKKKRSEEKELN